MSRLMLIDAAHAEETRVVVATGDQVDEFDFEATSKKQLRGNIYLATVTRVEPSLQAAFVEYGGNRHGFLAFSEIHPDYYQIPVEDREQLQAEEAEEAKKDDIDVDEEDQNQHVEEETDEKPRRQRSVHKRYKIQEVIRRRQVMLIQVVKEERGNKGAALTTYLSLAGRYCVLMPNTNRGGGISRKISNGNDRKRLKKAVESFNVPEGMGLIIRTAGSKRTKQEIRRDYDYLRKIWNNIRKLTMESTSPALIHEEGSLVHRSIRDLYDKDVEQILVEGDDAYKEAKSLVKMLMPSHAKKVQQYKDNAPIFVSHGIENQIGRIFEPIVQLKSGGYLVIHQTEALVAIDINSGRSTGERSIESTALKTNLEAASEIARQIRLRDLAGLIVIDFIDMEEASNGRQVEKRMKDKLRSDRARVQMGKLSGFGLLEISRQRRRAGVLDLSTQMCEHCHGIGAVRSAVSGGLQALRAIENRCVEDKVVEVNCTLTSETALYLLNEKRKELLETESRHGVKINIISTTKLLEGGELVEAFDEEGQKLEAPQPKAPKRQRRNRKAATDNTIESDTEDEKDQKPQAKRSRRSRKRKGEAQLDVIDDSAREDNPEDLQDKSGRNKKRRTSYADGAEYFDTLITAPLRPTVSKEVSPTDQPAHDAAATNTKEEADADTKEGRTNEAENKKANTKVESLDNSAELKAVKASPLKDDDAPSGKADKEPSTEDTVATAETSTKTDSVASQKDDEAEDSSPMAEPEETEAEVETATKPKRRRMGWWQKKDAS